MHGLRASLLPAYLSSVESTLEKTTEPIQIQTLWHIIQLKIVNLKPMHPSTPQRPLSAMGEACSRMDLTAIHQILVATHYRDDEGTNEVTDGCIGFKFTIFGWMICHKV